MTKARSTEINIHPRGEHQMPARALIRQESHHQILQQPPRLRKSHIYALGRVRRLLQEHRIPAKFAYINGDVQPLTSEDAVHNGDVLVRGIGRPAHGHDQDPALETFVFVGCGVPVRRGGYSACSAAATSSFCGCVFEVCAAVFICPGDCASVYVA
jgi:hypothetical protein